MNLFRRMLRFALCLVLAASAASAFGQGTGTSVPVVVFPTAKYPIVGNLSGIAGSPTDLLQARFNLVNCGSATPTISGVTLPIASTAIFTATSGGSLSGLIWGNDLITCNGTASTLYQVTYLRNNVPAGVPQYFRITGATDLTTATPVNVLPPTSPLAAGITCPQGQALVGILVNFTPVCQFIPDGTIYGAGPPSPASCTATGKGKYVQTDAVAGSNQWLCIAGTWVQQIGGSGTATSSGVPASGVPTGLLNGTNTVFTLASTPIANSLTFQLNGLAVPYSQTGQIITLLSAPSATDTIYANWLVLPTVSGTVLTAVAEIPVGAINGTNTTFTLSQVPAANSLLLQLNGLFLSPAASSYTLSGTTITITPAPASGDTLYANYYH